MKRFRGWDITPEQWDEICARHDFKCAMCGRSDVVLTVDHIKPRCFGGTDSVENLQPLCSVCNGKKGAGFEGKHPKTKKKVSAIAFRFTEDTAWLLEECSRVSGKSKAAILEELIRAEARKVGVSLKDKPTQEGE